MQNPKLSDNATHNENNKTYIHTSNRTNRQITVYLKGYAFNEYRLNGVDTSALKQGSHYNRMSTMDTIQLPFKGVS